MVIILWMIVIADASYALPTISRITYQKQAARELITFSSTQPLRHQRLFLLENPLRLVLDMERVANAQVTLPTIPAGAFTDKMRFGHFNETTSRIVFELAPTVSNLQRHVYHLDAKGKEPYRLVVQLQAKANGSGVAAHVPAQPKAVSSSATATGFVPQPMHKPSELSAHAAAIRHGLPTIVIDAGHGGKDPGASGKRNVYEKDITLAYGRALRDHLLRTKRYNVVMTRNDDIFLFLHDRVKLAREQGGVMFISLHADSTADRVARGVSVYTVSEQASDREAALLANSENEADKIGGIDFAKDNPEVASILLDLATRDARVKATEFALEITKRCKHKGLRLLKNPNRFAGFRVLKAPDIPSVLIEVGFLSNPQDETLLHTAAHRQQIAAAISEALATYFTRHPVR
jgi:N-acetylmuramoyl-L-alanine amidase